MSSRNNVTNKIKKVSITPSSDWKQNAKFRLENRKWLDYSAQIALRIDAALEYKEQLNQVSLAKTLKMTPQQVSRILRGDQNLTLKTIGKLSDAIGFELISFPPYRDSYIRLMPFMEYSNPAKVIPIQFDFKKGKQNGESTYSLALNEKSKTIGL